MEDNRKRNMERRRETSRFAARDRRGKEADIFGDLKDVVPIVEEGTITHLDRIALLRVAATVCRLRKTAGNVLENDLSREKGVDIWNEDTISECLDGFVIIADSDSTILYVTESIAIYLGLTQTDLTGRTLKEFFHPDDYDELVKIGAELHKPRDVDCYEQDGTTIVFRMKTVISPRGRCLNLKSALYKPVSFLIHSKVSSGGHVLLMQGVTIPAGQGSINANASALTKDSDAPTGAFMTRHTCDMRISFVSDRFNYILKSEHKSLMGSSFYDLVHPSDIAIVSKAMKELFMKGHVRTPYYRLVAANNTLAWVQTEATTISHTTKGQKGQYVICVHFVLGIQGQEESLVICTDAMPAGMQVNIKKEIDDTRDYIGRQPEIIDCVDFAPLIPNDDTLEVEALQPICDENQPSSNMGIYSVTDEYEERMYGEVLNHYRKRSCESASDHEYDNDLPSDTESIEDAGLAPEFDVPLSSFVPFGDDFENSEPKQMNLLENDKEIIVSKNDQNELDEDEDSFHDVLQWLFRDQPDSPPPPAPSRHRSTARCETRTRRSEYSSTSRDPPLASAQFVDSPDCPRPTAMPISYSARRARSSGVNNGRSSQSNFSPLADGLSQCGINSPPSIKSAKMPYGDSRPLVGGVGSVDPPRRLSTVQISDALDVPSADVATGAPVDSSIMFPAMPFTNTDTSSAATLNLEPIVCDDLQWEEPDLSGLAPYVDAGDMVQIDEQLPPELQALYDLPDFTPAAPSVPAARPNIHYVSSPPAKRMAPNTPNYFTAEFEQNYWPNQDNQQRWQQEAPLNPAFSSSSSFSTIS
ncbi:unnamed protein product [Caenorhabditis bovis]|uniref:Uncharacterized protein n=1 Tax=Caenorhabditis bovis TaxID=2654633 RepID=A0A8S1E8K4_9PELO|nr:unnamed protein product [Caenorhabditis bovis]